MYVCVCLTHVDHVCTPLDKQLGALDVYCKRGNDCSINSSGGHLCNCIARFAEIDPPPRELICNSLYIYIYMATYIYIYMPFDLISAHVYCLSRAPELDLGTSSLNSRRKIHPESGV